MKMIGAPASLTGHHREAGQRVNAEGRFALEELGLQVWSRVTTGLSEALRYDPLLHGSVRLTQAGVDRFLVERC
jgi:hypothetical protein